MSRKLFAYCSKPVSFFNKKPTASIAWGAEAVGLKIDSSGLRFIELEVRALFSEMCF